LIAVKLWLTDTQVNGNGAFREMTKISEPQTDYELIHETRAKNLRASRVKRWS